MSRKSELSTQTIFLVWFVFLSSIGTALTFLLEMTPRTQDAAIFCTGIGWILMVTAIQKETSQTHGMD